MTRMMILGVISASQPVHGYDVRRELWGWRADEWATIHPGSIYHALKRLTREGLLREVSPSGSAPGRRAPRTSTAEGRRVRGWSAILRLPRRRHSGAIRSWRGSSQECRTARIACRETLTRPVDEGLTDERRVDEAVRLCIRGGVRRISGPSHAAVRSTRVYGGWVSWAGR